MRTWTKRDPVKNYFPLPNEIYQLGLSHGAIAVYGYLLRIEDRKTYQCHPSYATIGKAVGMSNNTVRKYVQELEERGLIRTERTSIITSDGRKQNGSLLYTILPIQFSIDQFYQRQMDAVDRAKERQRVARRMEQTSVSNSISASLSRRLSAFFGSAPDQDPKAAKFAVLIPGPTGFPNRAKRSEGSDTTPRPKRPCFAL